MLSEGAGCLSKAAREAPSTKRGATLNFQIQPRVLFDAYPAWPAELLRPAVELAQATFGHGAVNRMLAEPFNTSMSYLGLMLKG